MNIGIDMMGGDFAPEQAAKGVLLYLETAPSDTELTLFGLTEEILKFLPEEKRLHFINTSQVIGMHEHPTKALKEKTDSSISVGFAYLAKNKIDAFISAGNTGTMLVGALFSIKAIEGVLRPTISTVVPKVDGGYGLLLDVGLNADCKPENLSQFALLGSLYAQNILGIDNPKVGLVNIGEEEGKGNLLAQAAYPVLKENPQLNFIGNIEGRDIFFDKADVMVCDGFTGNIILKLAESIYDVSIKRNLHNDEYLKRFHYETYGGTPVLGVNKPVIIGHGISNNIAFKNMILLAQKMIETNLLQKMKDSFVV